MDGTYSLEKSIFEIGTIILVKNLFVSKMHERHLIFMKRKGTLKTWD